jgi:hypothetical protein
VDRSLADHADADSGNRAIDQNRETPLLLRPDPPRSRHDYFFSSINVASLRIAGVNFSAILASSHGSVTSSRT